ncbi:MAG: GAF domain-containing protein [Anaerolineae bacterium]|nr:GAF domain-containing protein [Anaerolineae bacterium]
MMIDSLFRFLFTLRYPYTNSVMRQRAWGLLAMTWLSVVAWALYLFGAALPNINAGVSSNLFLTPSLLALPVAAFIALYALQTGRLRTAAAIFTYMLLLSTAPLLYTSPEGLLPLAVVPALIAGGVLLNRRQYLVVVVLTLGLLAGRAIWLSNYTDPYVFVPHNNFDLLLIVPVVTLGSAAAFLYVFSGNDERTLSNALDMARFMQTAAEHGTAPTTDVNEADLLSSLVRALEEDFGFFNVQVYMIGDERRLVRRARMALGMTVERDARSFINIGSATLVGQSAEKREIVVVDNLSPKEDQSLLTAPARRALAIPLIADGELFGVIEADSEKDRAFEKDQVEAITLTVQRTASLLIMQRRISELKTELREAQGNLNNLTSLLREQDARLKENMRTTWNTYVNKYGLSATGYDLFREADRYRLMQAADIPARLRTVLEKGELFIEEEEDVQTLTIPIAFRGELLGAMSYSLPPGQLLNQRKIELARSVAERLGAALENTRLLEQTQAQAEREFQASTIGARLTGITDVQTVLDLAAAEFQTALGAVYARAYLESAPSGARAEQEGP